MPRTYILIDFENTQPKAAEVGLLDGDRQLWVFRGPGQKKYEAEFAEALLGLGEQAKVVRCEKSGANALDMHIAFELGRLVSASAAAGHEFIVVSKDTDYEPLLQYLRRLGFTARREKSLKAALGAEAVVETAPEKRGRAPKAKEAAKQVKAPKAPAPAARKAARQPAAKAAKKAAKQPAPPMPAAVAAPADGLARIKASLETHPKSRPAKTGSLAKWLEARKLPPNAVADAIGQLQAMGVLRVEGKKVLYPPFE